MKYNDYWFPVTVLLYVLPFVLIPYFFWADFITLIAPIKGVTPLEVIALIGFIIFIALVSITICAIHILIYGYFWDRHEAKRAEMNRRAPRRTVHYTPIRLVK